MTVYGITRASTRKQQASPEVQAEMIRQHCAAVQLPEPTILDEPLGTSGRSTDFRHRPQGRWLLLHTQPGRFGPLALTPQTVVQFDLRFHWQTLSCLS